MTGKYIVFRESGAKRMTIQSDDGPAFIATETIEANRPALTAVINQEISNGHGAEVQITYPDYLLIMHGVLSDHLNPVTGALGFDPDTFTVRPFEPSPLPRLVRNGHWIEYEDGTPFGWRGASDFQILQRLANGEGGGVDAVLDQRRALGFEVLRTGGMCSIMFHFNPFDYSNYWQIVEELARRAARRKLRIEFTAFVDAALIMPSAHDQRRYWSQVLEAIPAIQAKFRNLFVEDINESDQTVNRLEILGELGRVAGVLNSHGSNGADAPPVFPVHDYAGLHPARPADWPRRDAHNPMEDIADRFGCAAICGEGCRPDQGRGPVASDHFDSGAGSMALHNGDTFHCVQGKMSVPFTGDDYRCAVAHARGMHAVPLEYRYGVYTRGGLSEGPIEHHPMDNSDPVVWCSRTYARLLGRKAVAVVMQRTPQWRLNPVNGWRVVGQTESVVFLER